MPETAYTVTHEKAAAFYDSYQRKSELRHQTHYCPGCGHGIVHKLLAQAIDGLGIQDRTVLISPVGCSVFAYYYFDVGNIQAAHGRAPAVATAVKRSRPESIVVAYQGDGDLAAIGTAEIVHAANRGENITVLFVNNGIYGMTGGQMAPTTPLGMKSTTSPFGRNSATEGFPIHVCELLNSLEAPAYIERVALGNNKQIMQAARAVKRAVENQVNGHGFSLVEILSPCPTIWKMQPLEAQAYVREQMAQIFGLGNYRDRVAASIPQTTSPPSLDELPGILGLAGEAAGDVRSAPPSDADLRIRVAGFGGQGVLMLGEVLAQAGMDAGYEVSWLPSYGPEMRSGTSNCHVRISSRAIDSPMVSHPNVLLAMNEPALRKFLPTVSPGGLVLYNGAALPDGCAGAGVRLACLTVTEFADKLGTPKVANMVMLGALLEATTMLEGERVEAALARLVPERYFDLNLAAIGCGREQFGKAGLLAGRSQPHPRS
jgi:2-oxoisovalerate ferredoxin oxidoreductase beta subunit